MLRGSRTLLGLIIRRDRFKLPLVITLFVVSLVAIIPVLDQTYGDKASLTSMYLTLGTNPAMLFLTGPIEAPTLGGLMTVETLLWWGLVLAFINTMLIVRHTRHNEEIGAQELILSGQVHRGTSLVVAMLVAVLVNLLIAAGLAICMEVAGVPWSSQQSWLYGMAMGAFGLAWAGVASIVVQLVDSGRAANSLLATLIGIAFVVRGIGDFLGKVDDDGVHRADWISNLSPFGWMQSTKSLTTPDWWPLAIPVVLTAVMLAAGLWLLSKRDVGMGLLPSRKGRARASTFLLWPIGLTLMLHRNIFFGWLAAIVVMVLTIAALVPQMDRVLADSPSMQQAIVAVGGSGDMLPAFMTAMISITSLMVYGYAIHALGKLRSEESSGHLEQLLSAKLSRIKWIGMHVVTVVASGFWILVVVGGLMALATNIMSNDIELDVWQYTLAGLSYLPILLAFVAIYLLLFGVAPRLAGLITWSYFGFVAFLSWLGPILGIDDWLMNLSVLEHLATPPLEDIKLTPLVVVSLISLVAIVVGLIYWRRRNLLEK